MMSTGVEKKCVKCEISHSNGVKLTIKGSMNIGTAFFALYICPISFCHDKMTGKVTPDSKPLPVI